MRDKRKNGIQILTGQFLKTGAFSLFIDPFPDQLQI